MSDWSNTYPATAAPTPQQISQYIGTPLWPQLQQFIKDTYGLSPQLFFSRCGMAPGWNVKYKKGSRSVCNLYPERGFFTCLVAISDRDEPEARAVLAGADPYLQELFSSTQSFRGSRWLMVAVTTPAILSGLQQLLLVRTKPPKRK
ncbi:DUF3788 domain-containing protein [Neobittarella massiliensis]|uniref:DUF3788 domain-containing protein n=1 Tax=Neobittarella massiliensis (ex Bilen et al. 2018) TaxID=2041842 RepID=A0A8J6IQ30_9FIRM|nr:DUF3788 domain-containing protein [Neobittarella massiliensis]MBC3516508.1 DUF3788 domain-containing protein [Neobittarella massiliensis]